jgi:hypothetical protein
MAQPIGVPGAASMDLNRSIDGNNRAELAIAQGDYARAAQAYTDAAKYLGATTPSYLRDLITAGLGLCALERGDLREARRCEQELPDTPAHWHHDPTTILAFRARLLDRRGHHHGAVDLLNAAAQDLKDRLVPAWLKVRILHLRLMLKRRMPGGRPIAAEAILVARARSLRHRTDELVELHERLG